MLIRVAVCAVVATALLAMPSGPRGHVVLPAGQTAGVVFVDPFEHAGVRPIEYAPPR